MDNNYIIPNSIAIIMDGNGRWAKKRLLPRSAGHVAGAKVFKNIAIYCNKIGVKYLTVYAFSTENWKRPAAEVEGIMNLLRDYLRDATNFKSENIKLKFTGDISPLDEDIKQLIAKDEAESENATGLQVNIALNYGGRDELVHAIRNISAKGIAPEEITEQTVTDNLYLPKVPDPDLLIRPGGEMRISNFLIWQCAYSEFYFTDVLWPDFKTDDIDKAIKVYNQRNRRFGAAE